jgi:hypothetical protein
VLYIVSYSYRLNDADNFDYVDQRTGKMILVAVCSTEYEMFCEVGAIWLVHQHRMPALHHATSMNQGQRPLFWQHRHDLGATTIETDKKGTVAKSVAHKIHLWIGDSGASCHMTSNDVGMFDCRYKKSFLRLGNGTMMCSNKIGDMKFLVVQEDGSYMDIVLHDCKYVPGLCYNLFSITKALSEGWKLSNRGIKMRISRKGLNITFDHVINTANGFVSGIKMIPYSDTGGLQKSMLHNRCHPKFQRETASDNIKSVIDKQRRKPSSLLQKPPSNMSDDDSNVKQFFSKEQSERNLLYLPKNNEMQFYNFSISFPEEKGLEEKKGIIPKGLDTWKNGEIVRYNQIPNVNIDHLKPEMMIENFRYILFQGINMKLSIAMINTLHLWGAQGGGTYMESKFKDLWDDHIYFYFRHIYVSEVNHIHDIGEAYVKHLLIVIKDLYNVWNCANVNTSDAIIIKLNNQLLYHSINNPISFYSGNTNDFTINDSDGPSAEIITNNIL